MSGFTANICTMACALLVGSLVNAPVPGVPDAPAASSEGIVKPADSPTDAVAAPATTSAAIAAPAPTSSAPSTTPKKPVTAKIAKPLKRNEPEEEWILLPETPKEANQPRPAADSSAGAQPATVVGEGTASVHAIGAAEVPGVSARGEQRLALVIGNGTYKLGRLPNSVNDAQSVASTLRRLGWKVIERENIGKDEMARAAEDFGNALSAGGVGLFTTPGTVSSLGTPTI